MEVLHCRWQSGVGSKSVTMATFAGPRRFDPMPVLIIQLLKDISRLIWRAYERTLGVRLVF